MSINEDDFKRGFGKGWVRNKDGTVVWDNPNLSTPTIDKYSNRPTSTLNGKKRRPEDKSLTDMLSGGHA